MITTEAGLLKSRNALSLVEAAYDDLRRDVKPKNERLFHCMAGSYIDLMLQIRDEIDEYVGIKQSMANGSPISPKLESVSEVTPEPAHAG